MSSRYNTVISGVTNRNSQWESQTRRYANYRKGFSFLQQLCWRVNIPPGGRRLNTEPHQWCSLLLSTKLANGSLVVFRWYIAGDAVTGLYLCAFVVFIVDLLSPDAELCFGKDSEARPPPLMFERGLAASPTPPPSALHAWAAVMGDASLSIALM